MSIRPIKSDHDYDAALEEIESLFASEPGTDDADRLEVLAVLAQDYQRTHFPIGPPDLQSAIEHELDRRGLTREAMAARLDIDANGDAKINGGVGSGRKVASAARLEPRVTRRSG